MKGISCYELLKIIPDELLENLEKSTGVNRQAKKLNGKVMFKLFLFSMLNTERMSLRIMEEVWHSEKFKAFAKTNNNPIRHSGIGERMASINPIFFQEIFEHLTKKFEKLINHKSKIKIGNKKLNIAKFDSTLVAISSELINFGIRGLSKNKSNKNQIKYTFCLKNLFPVDVKLFTDQSSMSEEVALKKTILDFMDKDDSVVVFDRGLQRRKTFSNFTQKNIAFVTRLKSRIRYKEVRVNKEVKGRMSTTLKLKKDIIVQLKDESEKFMEQEFRLISGISLETGERLCFLTNISELNAREITDIYKERWGIEMFFRFIKQELSFKHFVSRSKNGILVMLYMTLITALLLLVYKTKNKISGYKRAKFRFILQLEMEIIKEIVSLCNGDISKLRLAQKGLSP